MAEIKKLEKNSTYLKVLWSDGEESKFNYLWLRDNCPTAHDKDSNHRMFNILNVSKEINPKNYNINKVFYHLNALLILNCYFERRNNYTLNY